MAKALYLSSQNTVDCYKSFCSVSKFLITNTTFFPSWNICFIILLISITYLKLFHNYNTIKCICFINLRQRACMLSRSTWKENQRQCFKNLFFLLIINKNSTKRDGLDIMIMIYCCVRYRIKNSRTKSLFGKVIVF